MYGDDSVRQVFRAEAVLLRCDPSFTAGLLSDLFTYVARRAALLRRQEVCGLETRLRSTFYVLRSVVSFLWASLPAQ